MFALSVMLRYPAFVISVGILIYVLITQRTRALRKVDYWACLGLAALTVAPDLLLRGRDTVQATSWMMGSRPPAERFEALWNTVKVFFGLWDPVSQVVLVAGLFLAGWYILTWSSRPSERRQAHLLLLCLLVGPILLQGFWITHLEDRYLYGSLAPATLLMASVYWHIVHLTPVRHREWALGTIATCLLCICGLMLQDSTSLIAQKRNSYEELRMAGAWFQSQKVEDGSVILSRSVAQITYYSDLPGAQIPDDQEEFRNLMTSGQAKYAVITGLETHPDWAMQLDVGALGLEMVMTYPEGQPRMAIVRLKR